MKISHSLVAAALLLGGCATTYQLALMPRDSGKLYSGTAESGSGSEGAISITIEGKTYNGTWVSTSPRTTTGYASGFGWGWGGWHGGGAGAMVTVDNPQGGEAKALLTAADGSGLRCDLRSGGYSTGGGVCRDDRGREYDVQVRPAPKT
jgi:hypothetical protein